MRTNVTLGVLSLMVGSAAFMACGDDDSDGPSGGSGGMSGSAGNGNMSGSGGGGMGGGGMGGGGMGGGGMGGSGAVDVTPQATCTGCLELIVPVTGPNDNGGTTNLNDQVSWIVTFTPPADLSNTVITWDVQAVATNDNAFVSLFAQNGMAANFAGVYPAGQPLTAANFPAGMFRPLVLDLTTYAPLGGAGDAGVADAGDAGALLPNNGFDKSQVAQIGITLGAGATLTGSTVLRIALDSLDFEGAPAAIMDRPFTTGADGVGINMYQVPAGTPTMPSHHP